MPPRAKKTEPATVSDNSLSVNTDTTSEQLVQENETLKDYLEKMINKVNELEKVINDSQKVSSDDINAHSYDYEASTQFVEIPTTKPIPVVSLSDGDVWLKTSNGNSGKYFHFDKFGHRLAITYGDLLDVISMNRSFIEDGTVYICDEQVVKNNYLEDAYKKILSPDMITNILNFDVSKLSELIANTTLTIQESIISILVKKINANEYVDMNKISAIGNACTPPCDIQSLAFQKRA